MDTAINQPMQDINSGDLEINKCDILGSGAFGSVYKGIYKNEPVAVKSFTRQTEDPEREINVMLQCRSPYVLHLIGICEVNTIELKLVLQYMDGAWVVASGLADIHHNRCIHRDVKSPNILLSTKHYIKLADMGLTRDLRMTMTQCAGTQYWNAPEVFTDSGHYGVQADIYSFGVLLTELDTLMLPYSNVKKSVLDFIAGVCNGTLRPQSSINCAPWFKKLIDRCLAHDPSERPTASEIVHIINEQIVKKSDIHCTSEDSIQVEPIVQSVERAILSSTATTASTSSSQSNSQAAQYTPLPLVQIDINCPSCQEQNSILYAGCKKCNTTLLQNSFKATKRQC
ncbi:kinase [Thraustotheca clavata]|uniref:Kinase n=1 Tax=Thraustotheca clavata TaxID=74557 RepID=A0A1V9ZD44_9STRA|nr:kinase [Thraustotheca clavata]